MARASVRRPGGFASLIRSGTRVCERHIEPIIPKRIRRGVFRCLRTVESERDAMPSFQLALRLDLRGQHAPNEQAEQQHSVEHPELITFPHWPLDNTR